VKVRTHRPYSCSAEYSTQVRGDVDVYKACVGRARSVPLFFSRGRLRLREEIWHGTEAAPSPAIFCAKIFPPSHEKASAQKAAKIKKSYAAADKSGRRYLKDAGSPLVRDTTVNPNRAHDATDDTYDNNYSNGRDSSSGDNRTSVGSNSIPDSNSRCNRGRNTRARRQTSR